MAEIDNPTLAAALAYAARGWPVFPCRPAAEVVTIKGVEKEFGKSSPLIAKGLNAASADPSQIRAWWRRWPHAMIGLPLGGATGLFALDFDPRHDLDTGEEFTLDRLRAETEAQIGVALPISACVRTPSGGVHLFFKQPGDGLGEIRNRGSLPDHVDVRGAGGYVVAAPSIRFDGAYRWLRGLDTTPAAEAPAELIAALRAPKPRRDGAPARAPSGAGFSAAAPPTDRGEHIADAVRKYALAAFDSECRTLEAAVGHSRNNQCNAAAFSLGQLVGAGVLSHAMVRGALLAIAGRFPEFDKNQETIERALEQGAAQKRDLGEIERAAAERSSRRRSAPARAARAGALAPDAERGTPALAAPAASSAKAGDSAGSPLPLGGEKKESSPLGALHATAAGFELSDLGNAERWFLRHGEAFRWCSALGWLAWDGRRWNSTDAEQTLAQSVYATVRDIAEEAAALALEGRNWRGKFASGDALPGPGEPRRDPDPIVDTKGDRVIRKSDKLRAWGRASESSGRLGCIAGLARPWVAVSEAVFDADPLRFNCANGTLRFWRELADGYRIGRFELLPHDRRDLITKISPVEYRADATAPLWDQFFERVQPAADMRAFLMAWAGYNLTGDASAQKLVFNYGTGANGKSTAVDTWGYIAGDYSRSVGIETFLDQGTKRKGGDATPDLANLKGVRMVRTSEPERGAKFAEALIKLATGGEPISVRHNYGTFFDLVVNFKLTISGNHKPAIGTDDGIWRRFQLVDWRVQIPEAERDPELAAKLRGEASGVLNRMIEGLVAWLEGGLPTTASIVEATQAYRTASDPVGRFLDLCVRPAAGARVQSMAMHGVYAAWCKWAGEREWSPKALSAALSEKGYQSAKSSAMYWQDVELVKAAADFVDQYGKPIAAEESPPPAVPPGAIEAFGDQDPGDYED